MIKDCCKNGDNLEVIKEHNGNTVMRCKECGAKHYNMEAEPVDLSMLLSGADSA